nr:retrotransposon protein, putative, Ty1-copia subclass [Tanacetum cinerariifolium]
MTGAKFDIEKFDGTSDFRLWRIKMHALVIEHGCEAALEVLTTDMEAQTKAELNKKAYSAVILCLASYEHFVDTFLYGWEALTLEDVMATLNSKEIKEMSKAKGDDGEGLYVKGRTGRKLEPRAVKCVLLMYPKGVKGYRLYRLDDESPKMVTSRNVVFNKSVMYKDTLKDSSVGANKVVEELQVEVELQRLNNHTHKEDDQEDGDDEDAWDQEINQTPDLTDYQLARDREPRTKIKPLRFQDESNMATYAFVTAEEEDTHEPLTYQEAVTCEDNSKWKAGMKKLMDSLRKNKTWELVDRPAGQNLVSCKWLFKIKEGIKGVQNPRYKARLVARRFTQVAGIDYNEVFSLVVQHTSIRVILALTACKVSHPL